jgi:Ner family transcriptional regulator
MPEQGWHHADIVAAVRKKGSNLRQLSLANGLAESTLRCALVQPRTRSNRIIATFIGVPMHELWPAWFDADGRLKPGNLSQRKATPATPAPASPNRSAA